MVLAVLKIFIRTNNSVKQIISNIWLIKCIKIVLDTVNVIIACVSSIKHRRVISNKLMFA